MKMDTRMSNIKPIMEVPNADFKIFLYVRVHKKMIARKFRILNPKNSCIVFSRNASVMFVYKHT